MQNGRRNRTKEGRKRRPIEVEGSQNTGNRAYKNFRREKRKDKKEVARVVEKMERKGRIKMGERRGKKMET